MKIPPVLAMLPLWLVIGSTSVVADAVDVLGALLGLCGTPGSDRQRCERDIWAFVDVTGDEQITKAEITRFARLLFEHMERQSGVVGAQGESLFYSILFGPLAAQVVVSNFDYDGDGRISRSELYTDLPEGDFQVMVDRLAAAGNRVVSEAMDLALGQIFGGPPGSSMGVPDLGSKLRPPSGGSGGTRQSPGDEDGTRPRAAPLYRER